MLAMVGKDLRTYLARISAPVGSLKRRRPSRSALAGTRRQPARPNAMVGGVDKCGRDMARGRSPASFALCAGRGGPGSGTVFASNAEPRRF